MRRPRISVTLLALLAALAVGALAGQALSGGGGSSARAAPAPSAAPNVLEPYQELLAGQLGVSVETLRTAEKSAFDQLIDQQVVAGKLTPSQAQLIKDLTSGFGTTSLEALAKQARTSLTAIVTQTAGLVGATPQEILASLIRGQSLAEIAERHGVSRSQLEAGIRTVFQNEIESAAQNGLLTREQANRLLNEVTMHLDEIVGASLRAPLALLGSLGLMG